jgi:dTDP-L-rhamnose 4-epimerase
MTKNVLITGGAGFIGSHLAEQLLQHGYRVRVLDSLAPQVHGQERVRPGYLHPDVELIMADVRDAAAVRSALRDTDAVFHLAARVGVGQSMYEIAQYSDANVTGTAVLLEALIARPVERLIVASSMSVYGEGLYRTADGRVCEGERSDTQLRSGDWTVRGPDGEPLSPAPTPEDKRPSLASVYALSKYQQECLCMIIGRAYRIPTVALRFFNIYGERQALSNPYTGVLAIFAARLLNGKPPLIYEDGQQRRDFVHVADVATACRLALEHQDAPGRVFNIGSGEHVSVLEIAQRTARALGTSIAPLITNRYRAGDIRNCFADISLARDVLGYQPRVSLDEGLAQLAGWLADQSAVDRIEQATQELQARGLTL